jgi:hypothetical protein
MSPVAKTTPMAPDTIAARSCFVAADNVAVCGKAISCLKSLWLDVTAVPEKELDSATVLFNI